MKLPIIINEAGKIYIEAVPQLAWGKAKECTFIGALEAALAVTDTPHTYENLMGWSALAFRTRWYHGTTGRRWCPSGPVGESAEELDLLRQAIGWDLPTVSDFGSPDHPRAEYAAAIVRDIREGRPVLAYDPQLNVAVIFGFEDEGQILLARDYMSDTPVARLPLEKLGSFLCFLGHRHGGLNARAAVLDGLARGVANWHRSHAPAESGRYWYGRAALLKWREDLQHADSLDTETRQLLFFVDWWAFDALADARAAAERFLRRNSEYFLGRQHRHLLQSADLFGEEARLLRRTLAEKQAFLGPWTGKSAEHWTALVREREAALLAHILAFETEAFGELENMLDAASVPLHSVETTAA
ncbi:MAG TPA: hypothetical protein PK322_08330 [Opitutaceae bacterium]|nr:hypothetical protein [Opitutaceae bacterium]